MGEIIPPIKPTGCPDCAYEMPDSIFAQIFIPEVGTYAGSLYSFDIGAFGDFIEHEGNAMSCVVYFCNFGNVAYASFGRFNGLPGAGSAYVDGVGCSSFGGVTSEGYGFFVAV